VIETEWPGDLARAHDLPVEHAVGDWVLALDADEVLDPDARRRIAALTGSGRFDGYELPVRNYQYHWPMAKWRSADPRDPLTRGAVGYVPTHVVRLFRRREGYRYRGRVHQSVRPAIVAAGGRIGAAAIPIHHYGFLRTDRNKTDLYVRLARRQVDDEPENPRGWIDLGVVLLEQEQLAASADAFRRALALGDRTCAAFQLGSTLLDLGEAAVAIPNLKDAIHDNPNDEAPSYDRADAWEALGVAWEEGGRLREAAKAYRTALELRPDSPAALCNLAGLLVDTGRLAPGECLVSSLVARYPGAATTWSLVGALKLRQGDPDGALLALERALDVDPAKVAVLLNLALAHRRSGHPRKAARANAAARELGGTREATRLDLEKPLPAPRRQTRSSLHVKRPGTVLHVIGTLAGGAGRVLVEGARALQGRPQLVVCDEASTYRGERLRGELDEAGVEVVTGHTEEAFRFVLERLRPAVVLHHWWGHPFVPHALHSFDERWVCIGHAHLPMPPGYDAYVVASKFLRQFQNHLPRDSVRLIPNGVDVTSFLPREPRRAGDAVTIVMLSRLEPAKFPHRLLAYLPVQQSCRVLIAGSGGRRYEIEPELEEAGLAGRVRFAGPIPSREVPRFLARADIGLHVTETHEETFGIAVLEMLAAGLPVVAQPRGALPELIVSGRNGFLAAGEREIAARLGELVESEDLRRRMGAAAQRAARRFDIARFRASIRALVEEIEATTGS
jgi:glycosyltransferase involved in cell wall biosynthesis/cytochrome c-type biogenesis protein CcmH/NrfG